MLKNKLLLLLFVLSAVISVELRYAGPAGAQAAPPEKQVQQAPKPQPSREAERAPDTSAIMARMPQSGLLSVSFYQCEIRELLLALAIKRGLNVIMDQDVSGKVSVHLNHVSVEQALDSLTAAGGLGYSKRGDVYYIHKLKSPKDPQSDRLQVRIFNLKFITIDKVQDVIGALPGMRMIKIHEPSKTIIVEDTPENIARVEALVKYWDVKPKQVMIEAKILEISLTDDMSLGVDWQKTIGDVTFGTSGFATGTKGLVTNVLSGATNSRFTAALRALQTKTRVNTISTPKILAVHGKAARVQVGGKQGYKVTTSNLGVTTETIQFLDTGTILDITPFIDDKEHILLTVQPSINSVTFDDQKNPVVRSTTVNTSLIARSGETIFIGGLIEDRSSGTLEGVPILSKIPLIGFLFGGRSRTIGKSELVVLITPQILEQEIRRESGEAAERVKEKHEQEPPKHLGSDFIEFLSPDEFP
ncbi:MAG: secretin and TonB N-terminal domain-containing protein [Syntrophales bacterium]|nr:secretin and TonB N-terminal domain-containing protein [Syntrophales bacterium]MDD5532946.1 secretin and TonB N-terminal domain-containing protein [Syntrophales bacterium]